MAAPRVDRQTTEALLEECQLLQGFSAKERQALLPLLHPELHWYLKGSRVALCGASAQLGIVAEGVLFSTREAEDHPDHIIEVLEPGSMFGLEACFSRAGVYPTDLVADSDCTILFFSVGALLERAGPESRSRLLQNAGRILSDRCIRLLYKTEVLSTKLLRDQIMTFFRIQQRKQNSDTIQLKMNRQQFARYLCVNRSALSRELGRMQRDGLIRLEDDRRITIVNNNRGRIYHQTPPIKKTEYRSE